MQVEIYKIDKPLKLKYLPTGEIFTFYKDTELLKYNDESFVRVE